MSSAEWATWTQTLVLAATAGVVFWYTVETYRLRREAVHQRRIQLRPIVVPCFAPDTQLSEKLILRNIGIGAAFNVKVDPVLFDYPDTLEWEFDPIPCIAAGDGEIIVIRHKVAGRNST